MPAQPYIRFITPKKAYVVNTQSLRAQTLNVLKKYERLILKSFDGTTATFHEHHPTFQHNVHYAGDRIWVQVWTRDEIYAYLNRGTAYRWAKMSSDWQSKTAPGSLTAGPGAGHVVIRGAAMAEAGMPPAPGIKARWFTKQIGKQLRPKFKVDLDAVFKNAAK